MANDGWITPPELIEPVRTVLGGIEFDPCSSVAANKVVHADKYCTENGLEVNWKDQGHTIWVNPPYSNPRPWAEKAVKSYSLFSNVAFLLPDRAISTRAGELLGAHATYMVTPRKRVRFLDDNLEPGKSPSFGVVIYFLGGMDDFEMLPMTEVGQVWKGGNKTLTFDGRLGYNEDIETS